jgi:hypothetical protein
LCLPEVVDFYDQLVAGMEDSTAEDKVKAIYDARDRGVVPECTYHRLDVF